MAGTDLISALPLEIKVSILCCLKVKYAVRTSALAQSWRHLWNLLPCLRLRIFKDLHSTHHYREPSDWFKHANYLISSLRGPLLIFKLAHFFIADHSALLQCLLHLLLQKGGVQTSASVATMMGRCFVCHRFSLSKNSDSCRPPHWFPGIQQSHHFGLERCQNLQWRSSFAEPYIQQAYQNSVFEFSSLGRSSVSNYQFTVAEASGIWN